MEGSFTGTVVEVQINSNIVTGGGNGQSENVVLNFSGNQGLTLEQQSRR